MTTFQLTQFETETALWKKIDARLHERLQTMRERNDGHLDATETARLRGMIATYKEILAWAEQPGPLTMTETP